MASRSRVASKTGFFAAAREWRVADVAAMAHARPELVALRDDRQRTALHVCARRQPKSPAEAKRALATAKALVAAGADVEAIHEIPDDGELFPATTVWQALVWGRNRALGAYLLARGADANHCLFGLVWNDDLAAAKLVRRHGAQLDELGHGETPLIYAVRHERVRLVAWLLEQGADPNVPDRRGFTALHHAVRKRLPTATLCLLRRSGADVHAKAGDGATIASLATRAQRRLLGVE
jgi:ankyrin repeat protein